MIGGVSWMKNKIPKESIFKKKGFYVALYSCLGAVMVLAAVVSFNNLSATNKPQTTAEKEVDFSQLETTSNDKTKSYLDLTQDSQYETDAKEEVLGTSSDEMDGMETAKKDKSSNTTGVPTVTATPTKAPVTSEQKKVEPSVSPSAQPQKNTNQGNETSKKEDKKEEPPAKEPQQGGQQSSELGEQNDEVADLPEIIVSEPVFNSYSEDNKMIWPVLGEVVMDFSDTHAIYDKTLDQYRTSNSISISSDLGAQVVASAEGVVRTVEKSKEGGNTVVIDHGNGWVTTYSQLQDGVLVKQGDVVKAGQVIGGVSNPTIYSVLLGNHVEFKVSKDDKFIDPKSVLE